MGPPGPLVCLFGKRQITQKLKIKTQKYELRMTFNRSYIINCMRNILIVLLVIGLLALGLFYIQKTSNTSDNSIRLNNIIQKSESDSKDETKETVTVIAENLDTPWALAFLPDGSILVTERAGNVRIINHDGTLDPTITKIPSREIGEGGLLGITIHPDFASNNYVYLYYTYSGDGNQTFNRVVRMTYGNKSLSDEKIILDEIPGDNNHNGGRIKFGPDRNLYIGTGDAENPTNAQNTTSLSGKILRITPEGKIPSDNPFNNAIYSIGHRNVQGLAWKNNALWATEHGRSGVLSGLDELNLIEKGKNYGWSVIQGDETKIGMESPRWNSGSSTWAPSGAAFVGSRLFFAGLRGQTLYEAQIKDDKVLKITEHFKGEFGRLREVILGPDGYLYVTTSNKDGRGKPAKNDDRILKIKL